MDKPKRERVSGIDRAVQILDYLMERGEPATAYDIARAIGAPTSTVYEIIDSLIAKQMLARRGGDSSRGQVFLGPKLHFYGLAYIRDLNITAVFQRTMENLARLSGETVQICGRDDDKMVVEMMEEGPGHFQVSSRVGTRVPWNWTASGQLLVSTLPTEQRARLIAQVQPSPTGKAETDPAKLEENCRHALANRLSIQISESDFAVACIAAPVIAPDQGCIATVSLVVPESRAQERMEDYANLVRDAARKVEEAMGWARPSTSRAA
jgi:DNA-binding IclR family transcriptional regulator